MKRVWSLCNFPINNFIVGYFEALPAEAYLAPRAFPFFRFGRTGLRPRHGLWKSLGGDITALPFGGFSGEKKKERPLFFLFPRKVFGFIGKARYASAGRTKNRHLDLNHAYHRIGRRTNALLFDVLRLLSGI